MITYPMGMLRECRTCGRMKMLEAFSHSKPCKFGRTHRCKICHRNIGRAHRQTPAGKASLNTYNHSPKGKAARKRYQDSPKGKAKKALYRETSPVWQAWLESGGPREAGRKYDASPHGKAARKAFAQSPIGKLTAVKTRHRRRGWPISDDFTVGDTCEYCGATGKMEADHIIPVALKHYIPDDAKKDKRMFATACGDCNKSKSGKPPASEKHLSQVVDVLGYDIRQELWAQDLWQPPT